MAGGLRNIESWETLTAPINSCPCWRKMQTTYDAMERYIAVIKQFDVANNPRYERGHQGHEETYCNCFVTDVTKAMGCEVPHWYGRELNANDTIKWLLKEGRTEHGWRIVTEKDAIKEANLGHPVVVGWFNNGGTGHVAMVMPSESTDTRIAQAGAINFFNGLLVAGFGRRPVEFFAHD